MAEHWQLAWIVSIWFLHVLGLGSVLVLRSSWSQQRHGVCHPLFILLLLSVGLVTAVLASRGQTLWILSAATLSVMTIFATCDGRSDPAEVPVI